MYSSKLYDFYKHKDCNGSCVSKSVFCPPKDVCEKPNFVCFSQCLPAYYRQWYQVGIFLRTVLSTQEAYESVCCQLRLRVETYLLFYQLATGSDNRYESVYLNEHGNETDFPILFV